MSAGGAVQVDLGAVLGELAQTRRELECARERERRFHRASAAAGVGFHRYVPSTRQLFFSVGLLRLLGVNARTEEAEREVSHHDVFQLIDPDWRGDVEARWRALTARPGPYEYEVKVRLADGSAKWMRDKGEAFGPIDPATGKVALITGAVVDITNLKLGQIELAESWQLLDLFLKSAPVAIAVFDTEMRYRCVSERFLRIFRLPADVIGKSLYDVFGDLARSWRDVHVRVLAGEELAGDEVAFVHGEGTTDWVGWSMKPWHTSGGEVGGAMLVCEVVTERKGASERMQESEELFRGVFENAATTISIANLSGVVESCNPAFSKMLGFSQQEAQRLRLIDFVHEDDRAESERLFKQLVAQQIPSFEVLNRCVAKRGQDIWVHTHVSLLRDVAGQPKKVITLATDMTERKRYEEQIATIIRELDHRSKNLLGVVLAIARQTGAHATGFSPGEFLKRFTERIQALSKSQDLIVRSEGKGIRLRDVVCAQLAHLEDLIGTRIVHGGPELFVSPSAAQYLGMAVHELATNAAKYGALSDSRGEIQINWQIEEPTAGARFFSIQWVERNGPPVLPPARRGFGSTVTEALVRSALGADVKLLYDPAGVRWHLKCAEGNISEKGAGEET